MSAVQVTSEIGRLRRALLHEPGPEVDHMVPSMMEELLFDDILFGEAARAEHRRFRRVLELLGVELLDVQELLADALGADACRSWILDPFRDVLSLPLVDRLLAAAPHELAAAFVGGVRREPAPAGTGVEDLFEIPPLPNLCFQRDPQIVLGRRMIVASMAAPARWREALLAAAVFRFHPKLSDVELLLDPIRPNGMQPLELGPTRPHFEGGDVLVLSPQVLAVGYSERTNRAGIRHLARALARLEDGPRWLLLLELPHQRAFMHLDTVLTPIDRDACLVYAPLVAPDGPGRGRAFAIDLGSREQTPVACSDFIAAIRSHGLDLEPIPCGGTDPMQQQREQWTDGANALAVAPGVILLYDRNVATAEALSGAGFRVVGAEELLQGRLRVDLERHERTCILLPSHEMSRARGGPHCLLHPLARDAAS